MPTSLEFWLLAKVCFGYNLFNKCWLRKTDSGLSILKVTFMRQGQGTYGFTWILWNVNIMTFPFELPFLTCVFTIWKLHYEYPSNTQ